MIDKTMETRLGYMLHHVGCANCVVPPPQAIFTHHFVHNNVTYSLLSIIRDT